jgi:hypothetical protein
MTRLGPFLWIAWALHGLIAASNVVAARLYRYRAEMAKVSPFVREVFSVQNASIMAIVGALGLACVRFAPDLAGRTLLGRSLSGILAVFWGTRVAIRLFVYDRDTRRCRPVADRLFLAAFLSLTGLFAFAALWPVGNVAP